MVSNEKQQDAPDQLAGDILKGADAIAKFLFGSRAPGSILVYARNPRWHGEIRKREFGDFWADELRSISFAKRWLFFCVSQFNSLKKRFC